MPADHAKVLVCLAGVVLASAIAFGHTSSPVITQESGVLALKAKEFRRAEQIFSELVKTDPSAENFAYLGVAELFAGRPGGAIPHFRQSIQLGNDSPGVHYYLGLACLEQHDADTGIHELQLAIARDAQLFPAESALGIALLNAGRAREALPYLEAAKAHFPHNGDLWKDLVRAFFELGDDQKAIETIDESLEAVPDSSHLAAALAILCLQHQRAQKARQLLENAVESSPKNNQLKILLARASIKSDEPVEALAVLKGVPTSAGVPGELPFLRGSAYLLGGKAQKAEALLSRALSADPGNTEYLFSYATLQVVEGHYAEALIALKKVQRLEPRSSEAAYLMAEMYALMHHYLKAAEACEDSLRLTAQPADTYYLLGIIRLEQGNNSAAANALRQALLRRPDVAWYRLGLGVALYELGDLAESENELNHALALDRQLAPAYFWRARVRRRLGQQKWATADLETYLVLKPHSPFAYKDLEELYAAQGQVERARAAGSQYAALRALNGNTASESSFLNMLLLERIHDSLRQTP
jgi:tetratricopeptide (TPR) repeat protein